eukprot:1138303-Pelagomonas_calceolata.AAC.2
MFAAVIILITWHRSLSHRMLSEKWSAYVRFLKHLQASGQPRCSRKHSKGNGDVLNIPLASLMLAVVCVYVCVCKLGHPAAPLYAM